MNEIINVKDLSFAYQGKLILKDVSFKIEKGDFTGIIGPNGAGKSTLVKLLLKRLTPLKGSIEIFGENIQSFDQWSKIGYISQKANSFIGGFPATVEEIVGANLSAKTGIFRKKAKEHKERVYEALEKVNMQDYGKKLIGQLSGGQQQRVFIARVLVADPEIMILDEPTVGIDMKSEEAVYCLLARLNHDPGITVIMVTHDIVAITVHANKLICLGERGMHVHDINNPITDETLSEIYGYKVRLHSHSCLDCKCDTEKEGAGC
ncbi:MAG: metal ABC transporter ATP-binding protein [Clostridiaceae bacterium]|jgi:zinc transport system ATP-binding protein|nr:metal ABC transporter ATP-binding protein [Clostridiaceae bacterium]